VNDRPTAAELLESLAEVLRPLVAELVDEQLERRRAELDRAEQGAVPDGRSVRRGPPCDAGSGPGQDPARPARRDPSARRARVPDLE